MRTKRPSGGVIVAFIALFVALSGSAVAAKLITGKQIKDHSITTRDLAFSAMPRKGPQGPMGLRGPQGPQGPAGPKTLSNVQYVESQHVRLQPGQHTVDAVGVGNFRANCPTGTTVVGTAFNAGIGNVDYVQAFGTFVGGFIKNDTSVPFDVYLQAICATGVTESAQSATAVVSS